MAVDDWHERLIQATQARHAEYHRNHNRNLAAKWKNALDRLSRSRSKIRFTKGGLQPGTLVGMPDKIKPEVVQVLVRIMKGEEEVLLPQHKGMQSIDITEEQVVTGRTPGDSIYAILAALYISYQGPGVNPQPTAAVQGRAREFTDKPMEFNWRTRTQGVWSVLMHMCAHLRICMSFHIFVAAWL